MKERSLTLLLALGALALFYLMFVSDDAVRASGRATRPTSAERGPDGYNAALRWLERSGVRVESLRERYTRALTPGRGRAARGNMLLVTLPAELDWRTDELAALDRWLRAGNTLLIAAALSDQPEWAFGRGAANRSVLQDLTGIEFEPVELREQRLHPAKRPAARQPPAPRMPRATTPGMLAVPQRLSATPAAPHPWFAGVQSIVALSDFPRAAWTARVPFDGFMLQLARDRATGEGVMWSRLIGSGRIVVSAYGSPLTNRAIAEGDNARWLANLVAASVAPGGALIFDDLHQGISATYDGGKFFSDRRLWITIGVLLLVWLTWVLGATRLRTPRFGVAAPRNIDLVRAAGELLARRLTPQAAALRMIDSALPNWQKLDTDPRVPLSDLQRLRDIWQAARSGKRVPLIQLHNLILSIHRQTR